MQTYTESNSLFGAEKKLTFLLLCGATFLLLFIKKSFIENETAAFEFLQDRPEGMILQVVSLVQFITIPLIYLWKFILIAFVIWVGCFLFGYRVTYSQCFAIVIVSEYVFLLPELIKICWFLFVQTDPNLNDIRAFYPTSLMHFADYYELDRRYVYPLKALNLFEVFYWLALASGVHFFARKKMKIAYLIVLCSYVPVFFLWLVFYIIVYK
jgi:hypothetical protein